MKRENARDIDEYIGWFDGDVRDRLERIRATMHAAAPGAGEKISYAIPTLTVGGRPLIYFAAFDRHVSVYPVPREHEDWKEELAGHAGGKGTLKLPHDRPIPYDLIARLTRFRLRAEEERQVARGKTLVERERGRSAARSDFTR